jgi:hypothetical protein
LLALMAMVVAWRRASGALEEPLEPLTLLAAGVLLAGLAALARAARRAAGIAWTGRFQHVLCQALISAAVLLLGVSLCWSSGSGGGLLLFWAVLAGEEIWSWHRGLCDGTSVGRIGLGCTGSGRTRLPASAAHFAAAPADCPPAENVLQQLTLSRDADGQARLAGWLRVPLAAGQRMGVVHVAFCPPFAETPQVAWEQITGPESRIRLAQLLPYGARLELKLAASAEEPGSVLLRFTAWAAQGKHDERRQTGK